jgi:hypothetical protein
MMTRYILLLLLLCRAAFGACTSPTQVTATVAASGADYTTMSGCEDGEDGDLTAGNPVGGGGNDCTNGCNVTCEAQDSQADTTAVVIDGSTTDDDCRMRFVVPDGVDRHDGLAAASGFYIMSQVNAVIWTVSDEDADIIGFYNKITNGTGSKQMLLVTDAGDRTAGHSGHEITHNFFACGDSASHSGVTGGQVQGGTDWDVNFRNNIFWDCESNQYGGIRCNGTAPSCDFYYNTQCGGKFLTRCNDTDCSNNQLIGNVCNDAGGSAAEDCWGGSAGDTTLESGSDYNFASDTDNTGGTNDATSQTFSFVNETNGDCHMANSSANGVDEGESTTCTGTGDEDIDSDARPQNSTCDVGADEVVQAADTGVVMILGAAQKDGRKRGGE